MTQFFIVMAQKNDYDTTPFALTVFSTREKADEVIKKYKAIRSDYAFWIKPAVLDTFDPLVLEDED